MHTKREQLELLEEKGIKESLKDEIISLREISQGVLYLKISEEEDLIKLRS